jgi:hypothetical protein
MGCWPSARSLPCPQEFDIMKKLLFAAGLAAGLAAGAMPAFAQSATTDQRSVQAQNYNQTQNYQAPNYDPPAATSDGPHVGTGFGSDYERQQLELQHMPGYSPTGGGD